jgi:hypothetical protein
MRSEPAAWAGIYVEAAAAIVLVAADRAAKINRRTAPIAKYPDVGCITREMIGSPSTADTPVVAFAATRRIDTDATVVRCNGRYHVPEAAIETLAGCLPDDLAAATAA